MIQEFEKIVMDAYDKGVADTKEAALEIVKEAMLAEREACAKVCEEWGAWNQTAQDCAQAIRARGNK